MSKVVAVPKSIIKSSFSGYSFFAAKMSTILSAPRPRSIFGKIFISFSTLSSVTNIGLMLKYFFPSLVKFSLIFGTTDEIIIFLISEISKLLFFANSFNITKRVSSVNSRCVGILKVARISPFSL